MRKSIRLVLGMALFFFAVPAHAQKSFVTDELTSDATRLELNVGKDLGTLATQPLAKLRKDADQVLARKDFKTAAKYLAAIVAATPKDAGAWHSSWSCACPVNGILSSDLAFFLLS